MTEILKFLDDMETALERERCELKFAPPESRARVELDGQEKLVKMMRTLDWKP